MSDFLQRFVRNLLISLIGVASAALVATFVFLPPSLFGFGALASIAWILFAVIVIASSVMAL